MTDFSMIDFNSLCDEYVSIINATKAKYNPDTEPVMFVIYAQHDVRELLIKHRLHTDKDRDAVLDIVASLNPDIGNRIIDMTRIHEQETIQRAKDLMRQ